MTEKDNNPKSSGEDSIIGRGFVSPADSDVFADGREMPPPMGESGARRPDMVPERRYSFETPPAPIPEEDIKETVSADVIVVGGGLAGASAALSAAEAGASVILLEKTRTLQCRGHDNAFIGSRLQRKLGVDIDADEVILNLMKYGANKPDQRLLRLWAERGGEAADWLLDMTDTAGVEVILADYPLPAAFDNATEYYPQYLVTHRCAERLIMRCLRENAENKGVVIRFETRAEQLIREAGGRVTGVVARDAGGNYIRFNATRGVILCTGDYAAHAEMMAKYCPQSAYLAGKVKTSTGDGHRMALWVGAMMEPMPHAPVTHGFAGPLGTNAFLQVNLMGERFHNEDVPGQSYTNAVERQPGRQAWQVFDAKFPEEIKLMGIGHSKVTEVTPEIEARVKKATISADTIEELAEKMGVPVGAFRATVARYNELARQGKDLDFGKRPDRLTPVAKPPFYASKGNYELIAVMGGLNVNPRLEVLDTDWRVIPGLYAAGNTMGNRFAVDYPLMCPGLSHGMAIVYGRVAGQNAAGLEP